MRCRDECFACIHRFVKVGRPARRVHKGLETAPRSLPRGARPPFERDASHHFPNEALKAHGQTRVRCDSPRPPRPARFAMHPKVRHPFAPLRADVLCLGHLCAGLEDEVPHALRPAYHDPPSLCRSVRPRHLCSPRTTRACDNGAIDFWPTCDACCLAQRGQRDASSSPNKSTIRGARLEKHRANYCEMHSQRIYYMSICNAWATHWGKATSCVHGCFRASEAQARSEGR